LTAIFYVLVLGKAVNLVHEGFSWSPNYFVGILVLLFTGLMAPFTVVRLPPVNTARGIKPRVTAIAGTFVILGLNFLPSGVVPEWVKYLGLFLKFIGLVASIYCISWLGKSFSVMATARKLVTGGLIQSFAIRSIFVKTCSWLVHSSLIFRLRAFCCGHCK
jgi:protein-S-isoprenylcysteine O-methyltransferase Ste14